MPFEPVDFSVEQLQSAQELFRQPCNFVLGVAKLEQLPVSNLPEVAFVGRSNVGKSSLINAVTGQKGLAKTSNTPGRTQQLNYFNLADKINDRQFQNEGIDHKYMPRKLQRYWSEVFRQNIELNIERLI